jgi:hypothetical protein
MKTSFLTSNLAISTILATTLGQAGFAPTAHATTLSDPTPVAGYDFGDGAGTLAATMVPTGAAMMNFVYVGGASSQAAIVDGHYGKGFSAKGFSADSTIDVNNTGIPDGFFSMTIAPNLAGKIVFNGICFDVKRTGNASPLKMLLRSSLDNYATNLFDPLDLGGTDSWNHLYSFFGPIETTSSITFRLYPFLSGGSGGDGRLAIDQVYLKGYVSPTKTVPTPALLPALTGMGLAALRRKQRTMTQVA